MGVKGLTTYINQNSHLYLSPFELRDCNLVIDGNNLACQLYRWYGPHNSAYGGDYDRYSESLATFFLTLKSCNVSAYVIMDGGYEFRKLRTVHRRLRQKIMMASKCTPSAHNDVQIFPQLMKQAFKDVLRKLSVPFAQCDFEADDEIAAVARKLGCPVLSYDSDFYIYNVPYIPFSTCEVNITKRQGKKGRDVQFIKCKIYHVQGLVKHFGGLDSSLLPLMAVLLGNDYVSGNTFKNFFLHVKLPSSKKMSQQQKKIAEVIEWLKKETVESALIKILSKFKKEKRAFLSRLFERSIRIYSEEFSVTLKYLGLSCELDSSKPSIPISAIDLTDDNIEELAKSLIGDECAEGSDNDCRSESESEDNTDSDKQELEVETSLPAESTGRVFPPWLLEMFRSGQIDSSVANMFYLSKCYFDPQVEDFTLSPPYQLSLPILQVSFGLLVKSNHVLKEDEEYELRCFGRNNKGKPEKINLTPIFKTHSVNQFCNLSSLNSCPENIRLSILLDTMTFTGKADVNLLLSFPAEWRLYAMAIVYWGRQNKEWPQVTNCHIHALVLAIIALSIVDNKVGYFRNSSSFLKKHGSHMRKVQGELNDKNSKKSQGCNDEPKTSNANSESQTKAYSVESIMKSVSFEECLFLEDRLIEYHQGKNCQYSLTAVHSFAQLQSCLHQAMTLNSLLSFPVPQCTIANFYSAKFVTTVYADFSKRSNLEVYLDLVMKASPNIRTLHRAVAEIFFKLMPNLLELVRKGKSKRKKKAMKRKVKVENAESNEQDSVDTTDETTLSCVENRFSVLTIK